MKLFVYAYLDQRSRDLIREGHPEAVIVDKHEAGDAEQMQFDVCDVCFGNVPAAWISGRANLRWLQLESIGFEYYLGIAEAINLRGIAVTNLKGMFAEPAAETALAGLLALYRGIDDLTRAQQERKWVALAMREKMGLLAGRRALVCGLGSIGRRIRDLLKAFDCEVSTFARNSPDADYHSAEEWDGLLGDFDIIVNALPNTPSTTGIFSAERIARFARGAVFVNVGRGNAVDEAALVSALQSRAIGGAVLDVYSQEPLSRDHPLWSTPRTIVTQHTGGGYADELVDKTRFFLANLDLYKAGEPLINPVNLARGY